jgi:hypothetical protein
VRRPTAGELRSGEVDGKTATARWFSSSLCVDGVAAPLLFSIGEEVGRNRKRIRKEA